MDLRFAEPHWLWLLIIPGVALLLCLGHVLRRAADIRRLRRRRLSPVKQRFRHASDHIFWLAAVVACALLFAAIARPVAPVAVPKRPGLDLVILQDASASMRVADVARAATVDRVATDRWQRSMQFHRELGDALAWTDDRLAMIAFAHVATPQIRLTRDPNTLFFFLDHLHSRPPFRLEDDTTWDTNLEQAIAWGLHLIDKDAEVHGRTNNGQMFVMLSDGEGWSGEVAKGIATASARGIPLYVVGVGTLAGGPLPTVRDESGEILESPGMSRLERAALQRIAASGNGEYFELDRDPDRHIATSLVAAGRRRAPAVGLQETTTELYWWFIAAAAVVLAAGVAGLRQRGDVLVLSVGAIATAVVLMRYFR